MYKQERDIDIQWKETGSYDSDSPDLKTKWDREGTLSDWDFLQAATDYLQMSIADALKSEDCLIRVFAILDRRVGKRTIRQIRDSKEYKTYPEWVQQFYVLRLENQNMN